MSLVKKHNVDLTVDDVRDMDFRGAGSAKQLFSKSGSHLRGSVRLAAGKMVGIEDLNPKRKELATFFKKYLKR